MTPLIVAMLGITVVAILVVAVVAIPARRAGRRLMTRRGEEVVARALSVRSTGGQPGSATHPRTPKAPPGPAEDDPGDAEVTEPDQVDSSGGTEADDDETGEPGHDVPPEGEQPRRAG